MCDRNKKCLFRIFIFRREEIHGEVKNFWKIHFCETKDCLFCCLSFTVSFSIIILYRALELYIVLENMKPPQLT